jgi:hypothetical protein
LHLLAAFLVAGLGLDCGRGRGALDVALSGAAGEDASRVVASARSPGTTSLTSAVVQGRACDDASPASHVPDEASLASPAPDADLDDGAPATRYAALSGAACLEELAARRIPHARLGPKRGLDAPVRLEGPLSGVTFRTLLPDRERARSSYELCDCRLLLALDDFAKLLAAQGINEVMHFSAYRPPPAGWPEGQLGVRHDGGLAIDVGYFRRADGTGLNVERDFQARPAERPCRPGPPPRDATIESLALRKIVCDAFAARLFHLSLTPDYDRTHRDHFHFEVTPGARTFVAR